MRLRSTLVVGELALAMVLLAGAGLLARSFMSLSGVDLGFEPRGALAAKISLPALSYPDDAGRVAFFNDVEARIAALSGVQAVGAVSYLPLSGERSATGFVVTGRPPVPPGQEPTGDMRAVTPGYFRAMGIPLREGRGIEASDAAAAPRVAVVGESLAHRFWPRESAVGKRLAYDWDELVKVEIVGVAGDVRHAGPAETPFQEIYLPVAQFPYGTMTVVVRAQGDPRALTGPLRAQVKAADPAVPIVELHTLDELASTALAKSRLGAALLASFAGLGLLLAALGVYGLVAYGVGRRTREIGVRAALGARPGELVALVVRQGLGLAALGLAVGLAGALVLTRLLAGFLHGVRPSDPATFAGMALLLVACALLASWIPARRAARIDPSAALNAD